MTTEIYRDEINRTMVMRRDDGSELSFSDEEWKLLMRVADENLYQRYKALSHWKSLQEMEVS